MAGILKDFARRAKIDPLEGHQNVTIATGRQDSVYGSVIIEYKVPGTLSSSKAAAPNKAVIEQLKRYFFDTKREQNKPWNSMFGVANEGKGLVFRSAPAKPLDKRRECSRDAPKEFSFPSGTQSM